VRRVKLVTLETNDVRVVADLKEKDRTAARGTQYVWIRMHHGACKLSGKMSLKPEKVCTLFTWRKRTEKGTARMVSTRKKKAQDRSQKA